MARKRDRAFALVIVVLFLVTSLGLSLLVVWENAHPNNANSSNTNASSTNNSVVGTKMTSFTPVATVNSLQVTDLKQGTGTATVQPGASVTVYYTGAVAATGTIFSSTSTNGQPATLSLNQVIEGWQKGIPGMKVGGTRQLLIPAAEAYGANPPSGSGIPANAALVFDITLLSISK